MRLLLDENLDWRLKRSLPGHEVESVPLLGWAGIQNGELLRKAVENGFDVLITLDGNLSYQQNIADRQIAVVVLRAPSNRLGDTQPLMSKVLSILPNLGKGNLVIVE
jgi:predicted nuclease of predicted toxin-antitoxin system